MESNPPAYSNVDTEDVETPTSPKRTISHDAPSHFGAKTALCMLGMCVAAGGLFAGGVLTINRGKELTEETCLLTYSQESECTYECNCSTTKDSSGNEHQECDTCFGTTYDYEAQAMAKCEIQTLELMGGSECPMDDIGEVGTEFTCYVLDCEDAKFTLKHPSHYFMWGTIMLVVGSIFSIICMGVSMRGIYVCCKGE